MGKIKIGHVEVDDKLEIFILEDTVMYQKRMITSLKSIGFKGKITVSNSVVAAQKQITVENPGLILLDWNLPDGLGIEFLKFLRGEKKFNHVPILMVTTEGDSSHVIEAVMNGADDYVVKPYYETDLVEKFSYAFEKRMAKDDPNEITLDLRNT